MNKTLKTVFLVVTLATLVLGAGCNLKASTPTTAKPTATSELNFITPTTGESVAGQIATQTAEAGKPAVATATPAAAVATKAPVAATATKAPAVVASTATVAPIAIPTLARPATYALKQGEWPICIARRYDLDLATLFSANGLTMDSRPAVGAVLKIPSTGNWNSGSYGARALHKHADYKVVSGDTVYTIACYFGDVSPEGILAANSLKNASDVKVGMTLKIP
jgi:LysM repeat protein